MRELAVMAPVAIYVLVGLISLAMAHKCLSTGTFLPFHEQALGKSWDEIDNSLKAVLLSLLRLAGLGFLVTGLLLLSCSVVNYFVPNAVCRLLVPAVSCVFCCGLCIVNYKLHRATRAATPWKGSLYAAVMVMAGIVISLFSS